EYDHRGLPVKIVDDLENVTEHKYDAQGRVTSTLDPSGFLTGYGYDGLGRKTRHTRPENLELKWFYTDGADAQQVVYRDAKNQSTTYLYDGLGRLASTTYPDATSGTTSFDAAGNATTIVQPDGTSTAQIYDPTNRILSRTITPALGVLPPTTENYTYADGDRQVTASRGTVTSALTYDSLGRLIEDATEGYSVTYAHDASGNRSQIGYPSANEIQQTFNSRNQLATLSGPTTATFNWHGDLPRGYTAGPATQSRLYDPAGRLKTLETRVGAAQRFREDLTVDPRGLRTSSIRRDLGSLGWQWTLDDAGRLTEARQTFFDGETPSPGSVSGPAGQAALSSFTYDNAENLTAITHTGRCGELTTELPPDSRNRPASINGQALTWDGCASPAAARS
ncbi:MAG: hypothetical protein AAFX50_22085, partial [Acidobacteriota bacterium]